MTFQRKVMVGWFLPRWASVTQIWSCRFPQRRGFTNLPRLFEQIVVIRQAPAYSPCLSAWYFHRLRQPHLAKDALASFCDWQWDQSPIPRDRMPCGRDTNSLVLLMSLDVPSQLPSTSLPFQPPAILLFERAFKFCLPPPHSCPPW